MLDSTPGEVASYRMWNCSTNQIAGSSLFSSEIILISYTCMCTVVLHGFKPLFSLFHLFSETLQKYCSGKQVKEGWVLSVPYDAKHGVGTPYLKTVEGSSSSKGNRAIKR